jgi:hypothetical protein
MPTAYPGPLVYIYDRASHFSVDPVQREHFLAITAVQGPQHDMSGRPPTHMTENDLHSRSPKRASYRLPLLGLTAAWRSLVRSPLTWGHYCGVQSSAVVVVRYIVESMCLDLLH